MRLTPGARPGPYEILAPIGSGGMGEVYEARDTRLDRTVAIKISGEQFTERFHREARAIAALNHPHICQLYDVGPNYMVMELVEGQPLKGPLPASKAVEYALQICEALHAAHLKGIVHRDLKPANILVTQEGVKLLDFGLAKQRAATTLDDRTLTQGMTVQGQIVGTLQYMSPEQLQGKEADARSDLFSFGLVLYEMLAGRPPFGGDNPASTIAAILSAEPAPLSPLAPPSLERVVRSCLAKDPDVRFQTARDLKRAIEWAVSADASAAARAPAPPARTWVAWLAAALFAVLALSLAVLHFREKPAEARLVQFKIAPPGALETGFGHTALSPDGRRLTFLARGADGKARFWLRSLDSLNAQSLPGTEGGAFAFWSPDSRYLGFFDGKYLKKIEATSGGVAQVVCETGSFQGAAWSSDGSILFARVLDSIYRVPASGGEPVRLTELDQARKESRHYWPNMLPDGRHFVYVVTSPLPEARCVWVASLANPADRRRVLPDVSMAAFSEGHVLFARGGNLMAQQFDLRSLQTQGEAVPIAAGVNHSATAGWADYSVSGNGAIALGSAARRRQMTWFDRGGKALGAFGREALYQFISLSPDQDRVAADGQESSAGYEIFLLDPARGTTATLASGAATGNFPVWSPDGGRVAFGSNRDGVYNIYVKAASGATGDEPLLKNERNKFLTDWSRDGRYLIYGEQQASTRNGDLWVLPMTGERKPSLYLHTDFDKRDAHFSPDGRWVAYASVESSGSQVYVQSFPGGSQRFQISTDGGGRPRWRDDGRELYYLTPAGGLMAVEVTTGDGFQAAVPKLLFETGLVNQLVNFDVARGGQRFVMPVHAGATGPEIVVILNWTAGLKKAP